MNWQLPASLILIAVLGVLLYVHRKKLVLQGKFPLLYVCMLRTSLGLRLMDYLGKKARKPVRFLGVAGIGVGFAGMLTILGMLAVGAVKLFIVPGTLPAVAPVLPVPVKGAFYVPFLPFILSIFVIAVLHEFAHGVVARAYDMKVKSSGFAFLGIGVPVVPMAFVEPDENEVKRRSLLQQLSVFAAGPFANILFSFFLIVLLGIPLLVPTAVSSLSPLSLPDFQESLFDVTGFQVTSVAPDSAAAQGGLLAGMNITAIRGEAVRAADDLADALVISSPGDPLLLTADGTDYVVLLGEHPNDAQKPFLGITFGPLLEDSASARARYGSVGYEALRFSIDLIILVVALGLGVGLFNLLPLGPVDGGRMLLSSLLVFTTKKKAEKAWKYVSLCVLALVFLHLFFGFFLR